MATEFTEPIYPETAAKIRTAALEAIKGLKHAILGEGELNTIIAQTGGAQLDMATRLTRAATLALTNRAGIRAEARQLRIGDAGGD